MKRYLSPESQVVHDAQKNNLLTKNTKSAFNIKSSIALGRSVRTETRKKVGRYYYYESEEIGSGFTSKVYKAYLIENNSNQEQMYAIKVISLQKSAPSNLELLENEIQVLKILDHPNIIKCYDIYKSKSHCYIITEYCHEGCLMTYLNNHKSSGNNNKPIQQQQAINIVQQVVEGLKYLHLKGIVHRDIKPANILKGKNGWKIADFGFAILSFVELTTKFNAGTPLYMPLQSLKNNQYSPQSDIFAVGIILYQLLTGNTPWQSKSEKQLINKMQMISLEHTLGKNKLAPEVFRLLLKLCAKNKRHRMTKQQFMNLQIKKQIMDYKIYNLTASIRNYKLQLNQVRSEANLWKFKPFKTMGQTQFTSPKENTERKINKQNKLSILDRTDPSSSQLHKNPSLFFFTQEKHQIDPKFFASYASKKDIFSSTKDLHIDRFQSSRHSLGFKYNGANIMKKYMPNASDRVELKLTDKREDSTRCTEAKQLQSFINPQIQEPKYSESEVRFISEFSHIMLNQIHFCRFLYYMYKNSLYILLGRKSQEKLAVLLFRIIFSTLDEMEGLQSSIFESVKFSKFLKQKNLRVYLKSDRWALIKKMIKQYRQKYDKDYFLLKIKLGRKVIEEVQNEHKQYSEQVKKFLKNDKKKSFAHLPYFKKQLKQFLKQCGHNLSLAMDSVATNTNKSTSPSQIGRKNAIVSANIEGIKYLHQLYKIIVLLIETGKDVQKFERGSKIKVATDYSKNQTTSPEALQKIFQFIRAL